jgi:hypothetical protein
MLSYSKADYELVITSQTPLVFNLKDERITVKNDNINNKEDLYDGFDAMVLPRRYAGLCLPMNEALISGLPVFMTNISPNNHILPEKWLVDSSIGGKFKTKLMVVLQGKTVNEIHTLYQQCVDLGYTHFAFNHSSIVYQELGGSENKLANQSVGRVLLIQYLLSQNVIKEHHYIHLLGASTPQEFTFYKDALPTLVNSVDTSNPIICGALGIKYTEFGLLEKPKE